MLKSRASRLVTMAAVVTFVAACDGTTGPDLETALDTEAALADYEALAAVLGSTELASFRALGERTPFGGSSAPTDVAAGMGAADAAGGGRAFVWSLLRGIQEAAKTAGPAAAPIISDTHRGVTFVFDPASDEYAPDPDRTGAPETGVRFITYELDGTGTPIVEQETGHADLIDEGDGSAEDIVLHLTVVQDESSVLDYRTTLDENGNRGALDRPWLLVRRRRQAGLRHRSRREGNRAPDDARRRLRAPRRSA